MIHQQNYFMLKKIIAHAYKALFSRKTFILFNRLKKRDVLNIENNWAYQNRKLSNILNSAFTNIPYYEKHKFNISDFSYSDFRNIPILTKEIIRENTGFLINQNYSKMNQINENTSGGSTGEPVTFFRTSNQSRHGNANYFLALDYNGVDIDDTSVDFWGAERDMYNTKRRLNLSSLLHNKTTLNTFVLSDDIMKAYINRLNVIKPKFIKAYVHSIYDLSRYINRNNIKIDFTPKIHCTTGPLYPELRKEIRKAFNNAYVYNFYGSREVSAIATEVTGREEMFILYDNIFLEILDENDEPVKNGEEGEIVVTTLNNFYMPLIRYKIGDRGIKGDDLQFGTLILNNVVGRTLGVIHKKDGSKIDGQFFTTLFFNIKGVKNFQLVQKSISELELNIVKSANYDQEEIDIILKRIKKELIDVKIDVHFSKKISLTATGKIMYVYSELS